MATHVLLKNTFKTWTINQNSDSWVLGKDATLMVANAPAIVMNREYHDNEITILGDILNTGRRSYGMLLHGDRNEITIGVNSNIQALSGVTSLGVHTEVINKGDIDGAVYGMALGDSSKLTNSGSIVGFGGVAFSTHGTLINLEGGRIIAGASGVVFGVGNSVLTNYGLISGGDMAIDEGNGAGIITNRGRIDGDVSLLGGDDLYDNRKGILHGEVFGGDGDDTFILSKSIRIVEYALEGFDRVRSSATHALAANVEMLRLFGSADANGKGNDQANILHGNRGDNILMGLAGDDELKGGAGTDTMIGGEGLDQFAFRKGFQTDTITDFTDGQDWITVLGYSGIQTYGQLASHISQHGTDIWIDLGDGDKIVIADRNIGILSTADFEFGL